MARDTESPGGRVWGLPPTRPAHSCLRHVLQKPWGRGCDGRVEPCGPEPAAFESEAFKLPPWSPEVLPGWASSLPLGCYCGASPLPWPHASFPSSLFSTNSLSQEIVSDD